MRRQAETIALQEFVSDLRELMRVLKKMVDVGTITDADALRLIHEWSVDPRLIPDILGKMKRQIELAVEIAAQVGEAGQ